MSKKYFVFFIPLIALIAIGFLSVNGYSLGHFKDQSGIGGSVEDCNFCHEFDVGFYDNPDPGYNLRWVKRQIEWPPGSGQWHTAKFTTFAGTDGSLADADLPPDGACQVCHTATGHWRNDGSGNDHYPGQNCTACHPHFLDDITNYFEIRFIGTQSHYTHFDDPKGPKLGSGACFTACHKSSSDYKTFIDNKPLSTTTVCDACHSKNGDYDGVGDLGTCSATTARKCNEDSDCPAGETCVVANPNWIAYGAKFNWEDGIYRKSDESIPWPDRLKDGKQKWCAGCHDDGSSIVKTISAPNVTGDDSTYGYYVTGHGFKPLSPIYCGDCHDLTIRHTDGKARTYKWSNDNYKNGYRLNETMDIPREMSGIHAFELCMGCHGKTAPDPFEKESGFRNDILEDPQLHTKHLDVQFINQKCWDSDWDGTPSNCGTPDARCADSAMSCTACHNVHGSPTPRMTRHGELISLPGYSKVPALNFKWYNVDLTQQVYTFNESYWGEMKSGSGFNLLYNNVCWGCHEETRPIQYYRNPGGPVMVKVLDVWATDPTKPGNPRSFDFNQSQAIQYHVSFTVNGQPSTSYFVKANGVVTPSGKFSKSQIISDGDYEWKWDKTVPGTPGPAQVKITVKMFQYQQGPLIDSDYKLWPFTIH